MITFSWLAPVASCQPVESWSPNHIEDDEGNLR